MEEFNHLNDQLAISLYVVSKEVSRVYKKQLDLYHLTFTQYLVLTVLWENKEMNVKEIGQFFFLDSGTLTPLLKKLEKMGYVHRRRAIKDERVVLISLTKNGEELESKLKDLSNQVNNSIGLTSRELRQLMTQLGYLLNNVKGINEEIR